MAKVLVVDDELNLRLFISTVFKTAGYEVESARNGSEGMEKARIFLPDIVMLDLMMPRQGGIQMYSQLKTDEKLRDIPVVIVSAVANETFFHSLKMMNAATRQPLPEPGAYVEKPPTAEALLTTVRRVLGEKE